MTTLVGHAYGWSGLWPLYKRVFGSGKMKKKGCPLMKGLRSADCQGKTIVQMSSKSNELGFRWAFDVGDEGGLV